MGTSFKRLSMLLGGFFLALAGVFTVSTCGEDRVPYGAVAGALGGLLLTIARRRRSALLLTAPGAILGGMVLALRQGGCGADLLFALLTSAAVGVGAGLIHDSFRLPAAPPRSGPEPPGIRPNA